MFKIHYCLVVIGEIRKFDFYDTSVLCLSFQLLVNSHAFIRLLNCYFETVTMHFF